MRVAVIQMVSSLDVDINLRRLTTLLEEVRGKDVDAVFLPENFSALGHSNPRSVAENSSQTVLEYVSIAAKDLHVWMFAGTMPLAYRPDQSPVAGNRVRAASLVFDHTGALRARYDKIHMFDVDVADQHRTYRESNTFEHGNDLTLVETPWAKIGLTVCYDIRFSEVFLSLFKQGAELLAVPSAFTVPTGEAHFSLLMRARAVESFAFTIAACQGGSHDSGRETYGHSMVVNPWGEVLDESTRGEDVLIIDLDLNEVAEARRNLPVGQQRRL